MEYKPLTEPRELKIYRFLNSRGKLTVDQRKAYDYLEKGFEGEQRFYDLLKLYLTSNPLILHNLTYEFNNNEFQIDFLLIFETIIYRFEIKNNEGDYYIEILHRI